MFELLVDACSTFQETLVNNDLLIWDFTFSMGFNFLFSYSIFHATTQGSSEVSPRLSLAGKGILLMPFFSGASLPLSYMCFCMYIFSWSIMPWSWGVMIFAEKVSWNLCVRSWKKDLGQSVTEVLCLNLHVQVAFGQYRLESNGDTCCVVFV